MNEALAASPCVGVCAVEKSTGWCAGCQRTLDEISAWASLDETGRRQVLARVAARRSHLRRAEDRR